MTRWEWSNLVLSAEGPESPTVRLVLVALLTFVNETKGYAWPGVEKIAERSGHCVRTVQEALGKAEATGWLRRDAVPGRVTLYYPSLPSDRTMHVTPAIAAGVARQTAHPPPQSAPLTPAESAGEPRKESGRESKRPGGAPSCPLCSAPMETKTPRRKDVPAFWGCTRWRATGCKGRLELDEVSPPKASAPAALSTANFLEREREHRRKVAAERAMQPVTDAVEIARMALRGQRSKALETA